MMIKGCRAPAAARRAALVNVRPRRVQLLRAFEQQPSSSGEATSTSTSKNDAATDSDLDAAPAPFPPPHSSLLERVEAPSPLQGSSAAGRASSPLPPPSGRASPSYQPPPAEAADDDGRASGLAALAGLGAPATARASAATMWLPIDHFTALGVQAGAGSHVVRRAAETLLANPPIAAGLSQVRACAEGREGKQGKVRGTARTKGGRQEQREKQSAVPKAPPPS